MRKSVLSRNCIIHAGSVVEECIIGQGVEIGEDCRLRRVIVDAHNKIPAGTSIGFDPIADAERYHVDPASGIVVVGMPQIQLRKRQDTPGNYDGLQNAEDMGF